MGKCRDCEHWKDMPIIYPFGRCDGVFDGADTRTFPPGTLAYTNDGEGHFSALNTLPDFGCAMFQTKC